MKQKIIRTSKVEMFVVEDPIFSVRMCLVEPTLDYKMIGKSTELTEEDWMGIVDDIKTEYNTLTKEQFKELKECYKDIDTSGWDYDDETATESGLSLLKANGVVLENPISNDDRSRFSEWVEWESKVWRNCHVFIKEK